eukprot:snap_masked-scaffold_1-processed-gene-22.57-mRNA-1 protein AED:0.03 eAED:0.03 QI:0/-1/0/1/-1/1/1/0/1250
MEVEEQEIVENKENVDPKSVIQGAIDLRQANREKNLKKIQKKHELLSNFQKSSVPGRLIIKKMILFNFKSYAGEIEVGTFDSKFSAVIGPNGSGKSNVIDAMLFVFGKRAKKLRLNKVSQLIHKSSEHPNCNTARVTLHLVNILQNPDGSFEEVGEVIELSREAYSNNSSQYFINGKKTVFKNVALVLSERGIDLHHNRFLILQGEVEQISLLPPKKVVSGNNVVQSEGLLEYLEDIIGSSKYEVQIEGLEADLEEKTAANEEAIKLTKIAQEELISLKPKLEGVLAFMQNERYKISKKALSLKDQISEQEEKAQHKLDSQRKVEEELSGIDKFLDVNLVEIDKTRLQELISSSGKISNELEIQEKNVVKLQNSLKAREKKKGELETYVEDTEIKVNEVTNKSTELKEELTRVQTELRETAKNVEKLQKEKDELNMKLEEQRAPYRKQLEAMALKADPGEQQIIETRERIKTLKDKLKQLTFERENAEKEVKEIENSKVTAETFLREFKPAQASLKKKSSILAGNIEDKREELKHVKGEKASLEGELNKLRDKIVNVDEASFTGKTDKQTYLLDSLKKIGVIGCLKDLGNIDEKYATALKVAGGGRLEALVAPTMKIAEEGVSFLRKNQLGRKTFAVLDKLNSLKKNMSVFKPVKNAQRILDLVDCKEEYRCAFFYALENTLICDSIEVAAEVSNGSSRRRHRVVTLEGDLIEPSGAMSGGGPKSNKSMLPLMKKQDYENIKRDIQFKDDKLKELTKQEYEIEDSIKACTTELNKLETDLQEIGRRYQDSKQILSEAASRMSIWKQRVEKASSSTKSSEIEDLRTSIADLESDLSNLEANQSVLRKQQAEISKALEEVGASELHPLQNNFEVAASKMAHARKRLEEVEVELPFLNEQVIEMKDSLHKARNQLEKAVPELEEKQKNILRLREEMKDMQANQDILLKEMKEERSQIAEKEKERAEKEEQALEARKKKGELELEITSLMNEQKELSSLLERLHNRLGELESQFNDFSVEDLGFYTEFDDFSKFCELDEGNATGAHLKGLVEEENKNLNLIREFKEKQNVWKGRVERQNVTRTEKNLVEVKLDEIKTARLTQFMDGFSEISIYLKETYQMLTLGGDAELEILDKRDPFNGGVAFSVRPPKKSWKKIANLSGGEKTLSSLSLVFALHRYNPTPLYVMDEIDAALDKYNVSIVGEYIKRRTKNAQFIVISLRNNMFERADRLVGVCKVNNGSMSFSINPNDYVIKA